MKTLVGKLLVGVVVVTAACAPAAPQQPQQTGGAQQPAPARRAADQTLRVGIGANPTTLSPEGAAANLALFSMQFDSFLTMGRNYEVGPGAVERWELLPDNSAWRMTLRQGLVFGNGERATSADAVFTIENLLNQNPPNPSNTVGRQLLFVTGARVVDERTFDVTLRQRDFSFPSVAPNVFLISRNQFNAAGGARDFSVNPRGGGTGPYEFVEQRRDDFVLYRLRQGYQHPTRQPIATEVRWRIIPEPNQRIVGLRTGELDVALGPFLPEVAEAARRDGNQVNDLTDSYFNIAYGQQTIQGTPLADVRVRQAMNYAVNRQALSDTLFRGFSRPINQLAAPGTPNFNTDLAPIPFDQNRARQLLTEAGYPNGFRLQGGLSFSQAENPAIMQTIQDFHRQVGIQYDLNPLEPATYVQMALGVRPRTELISAGGSNANGIFSFSWQFFRCDQPPAAVLWCSQRMDQILTQAYGEPDLNRRNQLLRDASRVLAEEQALVFLVTTPNFVIVAPKMREFQRLTPSYYTFDTIFRSE